MSFARRDHYEALIGEVAASLFTELGCDKHAIEAVVSELKTIHGPGPETRAALDVRFQGLGGSCEVIITAGSREILRRSLDPQIPRSPDPKLSGS